MEMVFNGISNKALSLKIKETNHLSIPPKKIELIPVPGRTGDLIVYDDSKENQIIKVVCSLDTRKSKDFLEKCKAIGNWLQESNGYKRLTFSDGKRFNAVCINQIDISKKLKNFGEVEINFSAYEVE